MFDVMDAPPADAQTLLARAVTAVRDQARNAPSSDVDGLVAAALRAADALTLTAVQLLPRRGIMDHVLPTPMMLGLDARRIGSEARLMARAAGVLSTMPCVADAAERGELSWGQVRVIVDAMGRLTSAERARLDRAIAGAAREMHDANPDELLWRVDDLIALLQGDEAAADEEWERERAFLAIQSSLDGRAAKIYGEGDAESIATIAQALDTVTSPEDDDDESEGDGERPRTRAQRRFQALVTMCEHSLAGSTATKRPRPRVLATIDVRDLEEHGAQATARLLWALTGRKPKLSPLATDTLLCDADVLPLAFDNGRPVAVGDASSPIPGKVRTAVAARDQGCRFPGCTQPMQACDTHHIVRREDGGPSTVDNLIQLCRGCHRRTHRTGWTITLHPDGAATFTWRHRRFISPPRVKRE